MKPLDYAKAAGIGVLVLALDLLVATAVIFAWSLLIEPGHDAAYYQAAAPEIASWSTRIAGPVLLALFVWLFSRRRPDRNPFVFALCVWAAYFIADGAVVLFRNFFAAEVMAIMLLKLAGALVGAMLARCRRRAAGV